MPSLKTLPTCGAILAALVLMAGTAFADSLAGSYVDTMKGVGSARVGPDGKTAFTFAISANAYDGIIARKDTAKLRAQHDYILSAWVGSAGICPKGYIVQKPTIASGIVVYEGACK